MWRRSSDVPDVFTTAPVPTRVEAESPRGPAFGTGEQSKTDILTASRKAALLFPLSYTIALPQPWEDSNLQQEVTAIFNSGIEETRSGNRRR
jgi:hypothetical protein